MIIHLTGPDTFRSQRRFEQLRDAFKQKYDQSGISTTILDAQSASHEDIRSALTTQGFFSNRKFVGLNHITPDAATAPDQLLSALEPVISDTDVIVVLRELPAKSGSSKNRGGRTSAKTALKISKAKLERFEKLTPPEIKKWILSEVKKQGGAINVAAAEQLITSCGSDMWRLSHELEKLLARADTGPITSELVDELVFAPEVSDIFGLVDAVAKRQKPLALKLLDKELRSGTHPLAIIAMLSRQVRILLTIDQARQRLAPTALSRELGLHPFVVKKSLEQLNRLDRQQLVNWHRRLVGIDETTKSSVLDPEAMLDVLIVTT